MICCNVRTEKRKPATDIILLNMFDVTHPVIHGLPQTADADVIRKIKELTGRPVGINLEPLEQGKESSVETNEMWKLTKGRATTLENPDRGRRACIC